MSCWTVERRLTAYLDRVVSENEAHQVRSHLETCTACASKVDAQLQMRAMVRLLPRKRMPMDLTLKLRVLASRERVAPRWRDNLRLTIQNLMQPIALPAAGGLFAAVLLFMALIPTFARTHSSNADVPISLYTEPALITLKPIGFEYGDAEVNVRIDQQGRLISYSIVSGSSIEKDLLRRSIENNLLFTTFTPATAFGKPTTGTLRLSFRSSRIDVKG